LGWLKAGVYFCWKTGENERRHPLSSSMERQDLTPEMEVAMYGLLGGMNRSEAARLARVNPNTLTAWLQLGSAFEEIYFERRCQIWDALRVQLTNLYAQAIKRLEALLDSSDVHVAIKACSIALQAVGQGPPGASLRPSRSYRETEELKQWKDYNNPRYYKEEYTTLYKIATPEIREQRRRIEKEGKKKEAEEAVEKSRETKRLIENAITEASADLAKPESHVCFLTPPDLGAVQGIIPEIADAPSVQSDSAQSVHEGRGLVDRSLETGTRCKRV
jgi:hypothetical protein